jgi:choline kinase
MQIDYALILSAGLGTRMGEIGKKIPKVLWPVYFKTLLELQINYCVDLNVKNIYINTHFLHDEIKAFLEEHNLETRVTILHENPLLDSGGAIHNLAARPEVNYNGTLLLVNGDQFLFFENKYWQLALQKIKNVRAVLFGIQVQKEAAYNETVLKNDCLVEIIKNTAKDHDYVTYSGLGLLNLNGLKHHPGISRFFETVANYKNEKVEFVTPVQFEYWDYGTAEIYAESILKLCDMSARSTAMGNFLTIHGAFKGNQQEFVNFEKKSIDLEAKGNFASNSILANGIIQKF